MRPSDSGNVKASMSDMPVRGAAMNDDLYDRVMEHYTRIEENILGIQAKLDNPRVPLSKKQLLRGTLARQRAVASIVAASLYGGPVILPVSMRPPVRSI